MVAKAVYTKEAILELLETICDPEIPVVSIREIGILRDVVLAEDQCTVIITPTYTACPAMDFIAQDILALLQSYGIPNPKVSLVNAPAWTTDWMTDIAKEKLRNFGISPPVHSSCVNWIKASAANVPCPRCHSTNTKLISQFGSTACKALYSCNDCKEPFDYFKCH